MSYIIKQENKYFSGYNSFTGLPELGETPLEIAKKEDAKAITNALNVFATLNKKVDFQLYQRTDALVSLTRAKKKDTTDTDHEVTIEE